MIKKALLVLAAGTMVLAACGGGASDVVASDRQGGEAPGGGDRGTVRLYAYSAPKPGFDAVIRAFAATGAGSGVTFEPSYGASGDQSRKVAAGAPADVVSFSLEPDVTRLVDTIRSAGVKTIFAESSVNPKVEQAIAREAGARVGPPLWADSLGEGVTYIGSIEANTRALVEGFTGRPAECALGA